MIEVRRSGDRFVTRTDWLVSRHSFSFGSHYDPDDVGFGPLLVLNEDVLAPGTGFDTHPHRETEIITWMLEGTLTHRDSEGRAGTVVPGLVQRLSAGRGLTHSERNEEAEPAHYVQMWLAPDVTGGEPGYEQRDLGAALETGELVTVASGDVGDGAGAPALPLRRRGAALRAVRLRPGRAVELASAEWVHVFVARGRVELAGVGGLAAGDAARIRRAGARLSVPGSGSGSESGSAEILVWQMSA